MEVHDKKFQIRELDKSLEGTMKKKILTYLLGAFLLVLGGFSLYKIIDLLYEKIGAKDVPAKSSETYTNHGHYE